MAVQAQEPIKLAVMIPHANVITFFMSVLLEHLLAQFAWPIGTKKPD